MWRRLKQLSFSREVQEVTYLLLHDKLPVHERTFRIGLSRDPYCTSCSSASIQDVDHFFIYCDLTSKYWEWTRSLCDKLIGNPATLSDTLLLKLNWPQCKNDRSILWLIGHYTFLVWDMLFIRKLTKINEGEFFGFMKYKYREALQMGITEVIDGLV